MKKWRLLMLVLILALAGCGGRSEPTSAAPYPTTDAASREPLKVYALDGGGYDNAALFGEQLLLIRAEEQTELILTDGSHTVQSVALEGSLTLENGGIRLLDTGLAYYAADSNEMVFLNQELRELSRVTLPEDHVGTPFLSSDGASVFYSTGSELREMNLRTGVKRLIFQSEGKSSVITGLLWDGTVLRCDLEMSDGTVETVLMRAETGEILAMGKAFDSLIAEGGIYVVRLNDAAVTETVFGIGIGEVQTVEGIGSEEALYLLPAENALITVSPGEDGCRIRYFELISGKRTAGITLPGAADAWGITVGPDGAIWFYQDGDSLCRWDPELSPTDDVTDYTHPRYTRENPDTEGLEACTQAAGTLEQKFGVSILIAEAVTEYAPENYTLVPEHMIAVYEQYLPVVERVLSQFPEGFLAGILSGHGGTLHIGLVRQVQGSAALGTLDREQGIQYWSGRDACLMVVPGEGMEQSLYQQLMYVIESRVLSTTSAYDGWDKLNPAGFSYDNDYLANQNRDGTQYLQEDTRAFIDTFSMSYAREDRARIFACAATPGNEALFRSDTMQKKLKLLCAGIRQACGLTGSSQSFIWEQYLAQEK